MNVAISEILCLIILERVETLLSLIFRYFSKHYLETASVIRRIPMVLNR